MRAAHFFLLIARASEKKMGNLTSRRRSAATTTQESPRSLLNEETTRGEDKGNGSKRSSFEAVDAARGMSPPDMVAVQIRYSHNLRRLFTEGNLQRLLVNLYEVNTSARFIGMAHVNSGD